MDLFPGQIGGATVYKPTVMLNDLIVIAAEYEDKHGSSPPHTVRVILSGRGSAETSSVI